MSQPAVMPPTRPWIIATVIGLIVAGCGGEGSNDRSATPAAATAAAGCSDVTEALVADSVTAFQGTLNVATTGAANLEALERVTGLPDAGVYRALADVLDGLALDDVETSRFGSPREIMAGLERMADLLDTALAGRDDPGGPAWVELQAYAKHHLVRLQAGTNHYLAEAGCLD